ncbi:MAG: cellulase family glycosylhydrolase [Saprospiraceae bacterium]|nr:cellulase family glycosylhydrolase [Saprospiraceae bacterium]
MSELRRRAILLLTYVVLCAIAVASLAKLLAYFHVGADRSALLESNAAALQRTAHPYSWRMKEDLTHRFGREAQAQLASHFMQAVQARQLYHSLEDEEILIDFYTAAFLAKLQQFREERAQNKVQHQSLQHHLTLEFLSEEGSLAILHDSASLEVVELVLPSGEKSYQFMEASYRAMMLLVDGRWRIRHLEQLDRKQMPHTTLSHQLDFTGDIKGVNYYPQEHPWQMFGEHFDGELVDRDFGKIESLGFNHVRLFVPFTNNGSNWHLETLCMQLKKSLDYANTHGLEVTLTLFDMYGDYALQSWPKTLTQLEALVTSLRGHPALRIWDIKNEPDLDYASRGRERVDAWLHFMLHQIREMDPNHPVTIGWSSVVAATDSPHDEDIASFHYYGSVEDFPPALRDMEALKKEKPLLLQEYGFSSYGGFLWPFGPRLSKQTLYHEGMQNIISQASIPWMVWTLYDFKAVPSSVVGRLPWRKARQKQFGLIDLQGNVKPVLSTMKTKN